MNTDHLRGVTPGQFALTTYAMGEMGRMLEAADKIEPHFVAQTATALEHRRLLAQSASLLRWLGDLQAALERRMA